MKLYKSFKADFKNEHGNIKWEIGQWFHQNGKIECCKKGFHASTLPLDAMRFVNCEIIALVSVKGKSDKQDDKQAWSDMKIDKAWYWKKEDSVALSIYAAELCINNFEKEFPEDKRPREAIEAAKKWLENPTAAESAESAARSAESAARSAESAARSAARSVESAESAARSAWSAAESAARSAMSAARSAARSAMSAMSAAESAMLAARSAAESAMSAAESAHEKTWKELNKWVETRIKSLEEIKNV